jgi:hypothetical protein
LPSVRQRTELHGVDHLRHKINVVIFIVIDDHPLFADHEQGFNVDAAGRQRDGRLVFLLTTRGCFFWLAT